MSTAKETPPAQRAAAIGRWLTAAGPREAATATSKVGQPAPPCSVPATGY